MATKDKSPDIDTLRRLVAHIDRQIERPDIDVLIDQLKGEGSLRLTERPKGSGLCTARMAGVTSPAIGSARGALENWANAARREIRKAEAA